MIKNNFYPLRTIVGSSISIRRIIPYLRVAPPLNIVVRKHPDINDAVIDDIYSNYLPDIIKDNVTYHPVPGMNTMPVSDSNLLPVDNMGAQRFLNIFKNPSDIPFPATESVASIFGYQEDNFIELKLNSQVQDDQELTNHFYSGRDRTYSFFILLDKEELVGGMCFNGYPFIASRIEDTVEGMTVGNFGLPREMSLTPLPSFVGKSIEELTGFQGSQFIDSEFAYTRQEILSHSGLNFLTIDPVKTNLFLLTITDLPFIPKTIDLDIGKGDFQNPLSIQGYKGFAIPYLYFFEYKEQTKRNARLHSGLLGVKRDNSKNADDTLKFPAPLNEDGSQDILRRAFPEWEYYFLKDASEKPKYTKDEILIKIAREEAELQNNPSNVEQLRINITTLRAMLAELENVSTQTGVYWLYTAHSALGQRREFDFSYANLNYSDKVRELLAMRRKKTLTECFISDLLQPNEKVTLYLQQGEEYDRCVAGLKALFLLVPDGDISEKFAERLANMVGVGINDNQLSDEERTFIEDALAFASALPPETNFCEEFRLRIYEVDPIEGVSPASVDLNSKYATLLSDDTINDFIDVVFSQLLKGIPFRKTSTAKYFALEFTNTGQKAGQVAIHSLQIIRSANVSVQPRPAKTQQVKAMHYRIIGPELADDFSKLGNEGFNFSIDRVTAGQTKNVLYSAMSLLDLLHTGGARIQSNVRRRAVEFEKSNVTNEGGGDLNFERRTLYQNSNGWRSNETGEGVNGNEFDNKTGIAIKPLMPFENYGNQETRIHNNLLFPIKDGPWRFLNNYFGVISDLASRGLIKPSDVIIATNNLHHGGWENKHWKGVNKNKLKILGTNSVSTSPFSQMRAINDLINFQNQISNPLDLAVTIGELIGGGNWLSALCGNYSSSIMLTIAGLGASIGNQPYPNFSHTTTYGTSGNITKQAFETGYSFGQLLVRGADIMDSKSLVVDGEMKRVITRREVPNTDKDRVRGAEVMWQDKIQDIITGSIPLNLSLPATATKMNFRTADDSLRVRFNSGFSPSIQVDFWFELTEETIKDDN